jgi:hypothetical protein
MSNNLPDTQNTAAQGVRNLFNGVFYQPIPVNDTTYGVVYSFFLDKTKNSQTAAQALTDSLIAMSYLTGLDPLTVIKEFDNNATASDIKKALISIFNAARIPTSQIGFLQERTKNQWTVRNLRP